MVGLNTYSGDSREGNPLFYLLLNKLIYHDNDDDERSHSEAMKIMLIRYYSSAL